MQVIQSIHNNSLCYMIHNAQLQLSILHGAFQSWHHQFNLFNFQQFLLCRNIKITSNQTSFFKPSSKSKPLYSLKSLGRTSSRATSPKEVIVPFINLLCRKVSGIHTNEVTDFVFFRIVSEFTPSEITENGIFYEAVTHLADSKPT